MLHLDARPLDHLGRPDARPRRGDLCGIHKGTPVLDLDYAEDSGAETDANFVITGGGGLVEVQGTAEGKPFSEEEFLSLMRLAKAGTAALVALQKQAIA